MQLVCFLPQTQTSQSPSKRDAIHSILLPVRAVVRTIYTSRLHLKCDGTCAETRFRLSAKRTSPLKSAGASVQSTTGGRGVRISGSNAGYIMFRGSVKGNGYPLHSPVSPSLPLPCVTVCHHISTGLYCSTHCLNVTLILMHNLFYFITQFLLFQVTITEVHSLAQMMSSNNTLPCFYQPDRHKGDNHRMFSGNNKLLHHLTFWRRNYFFNFSTLCI